MAADELAQSEVVSQGGRQEKPCVGQQAVVEGRREPVKLWDIAPIRCFLCRA